MSFTSDLDRFLRKVNVKMNDVATDITLEMLTRFVLRSPVDTGYFRSNWQVEQRSIPAGELEITSSEDVIARGRSVIEQWDISNVLYIVNNTEYGIYLEDGHSAQAPQGIVDITVLEFEPLLRKMANEL